MIETQPAQPEFTLEDLRQLAKDDLFFFAKFVLGYDKLDPKIHGPLCLMLEDATKNRKKIVLPRGWYKTTVISKAYPIWRAIRNPNIRILLVQNTFDNAAQKLSEIDQQFRTNELFRTLFPEILPGVDNVWKQNSMCVTRTRSYSESTFECAGIGTDLVSRHYDIIIEDDTVAPKTDEMGEDNLAPSKEDIGKAIGFHRLTLGLLNDPSDELIVVGTRWFEKDLLSWIDDNEGKYYARYERACKEANGVPDPRGRLAWPERFDEAKLEEMKARYGEYMFSCLCMNRPMRSENMPFKKEWFKFYEPERRPRKLMVYTRIDPAGDAEQQKGRNNDYNTVVTTGKDMETGFIYVLEATRERCNPGKLIDILFGHIERWTPLKVQAESNAYQSTLGYWVRERMRSTGKFFIFEGVSSRRNKNARIMGLQPIIAAGAMLFLPVQRWLIAEFEAFPLGAHDDGIDALSGHLDLWAATPTKNAGEEEVGTDGFSVEGFIAEIEQDYQNAKGIVYDVLVETTNDDGLCELATGARALPGLFLN